MYLCIIQIPVISTRLTLFTCVAETLQGFEHTLITRVGLSGYVCVLPCLQPGELLAWVSNEMGFRIVCISLQGGQGVDVMCVPLQLYICLTDDSVTSHADSNTRVRIFSLLSISSTNIRVGELKS